MQHLGRGLLQNRNRVCIFQERVCIFQGYFSGVGWGRWERIKLLKTVSCGLGWFFFVTSNCSLHCKHNYKLNLFMQTLLQEDQYRSVLHLWAWLEEAYGIVFKHISKTKQQNRLVQKVSKLWWFRVSWVTTGRYSVEMRHIVSGNLFKHVPGLQDLNKITKTHTSNNTIIIFFVGPMFLSIRCNSRSSATGGHQP